MKSFSKLLSKFNKEQTEEVTIQGSSKSTPILSEEYGIESIGNDTIEFLIQHVSDTINIFQREESRAREQETKYKTRAKTSLMDMRDRTDALISLKLSKTFQKQADKLLRVIELCEMQLTILSNDTQPSDEKDDFSKKEKSPRRSRPKSIYTKTHEAPSKLSSSSSLPEIAMMSAPAISADNSFATHMEARRKDKRGSMMWSNSPTSTPRSTLNSSSPLLASSPINRSPMLGGLDEVIAGKAPSDLRLSPAMSLRVTTVIPKDQNSSDSDEFSTPKLKMRNASEDRVGSDTRVGTDPGPARALRRSMNNSISSEHGGLFTPENIDLTQLQKKYSKLKSKYKRQKEKNDKEYKKFKQLRDDLTYDIKELKRQNENLRKELELHSESESRLSTPSTRRGRKNRHSLPASPRLDLSPVPMQ